MICVSNPACRKARLSKLRNMKGRATSCRFGPPLFCPCFHLAFLTLRHLEYPRIENCYIRMEEVSWPSCKVHFPDGGPARGEAAIVGLQRNFIGFAVLLWDLNDWEVSHDRLNVKEVISLTRTWSKTLGNWSIVPKIDLGLQNLEKDKKFRVW